MMSEEPCKIRAFLVSGSTLVYICFVKSKLFGGVFGGMMPSRVFEYPQNDFIPEGLKIIVQFDTFVVGHFLAITPILHKITRQILLNAPNDRIFKTGRFVWQGKVP